MPSVPPPQHSEPGPAPTGHEDPRPAPAPAGREGALVASVPAWVPFVAMIVVFVAAGIVAAVIAGIAALGGSDIGTGSTPPGVIIVGTFFQDGLFIAGAYFGVRLYSLGRVRPSTLGFRHTALWPAVGWTVLSIAAFAIFSAVYLQLLGEPPEQQLVKDLRAQESVLVLAGYLLVVAVGAPLVEETFFRGFMFGVLREKLPFPAAVVLAGGTFGLAHAIGTPVQTLGILVVLGVLFCLLYWRTRSLLPGMSLHAAVNSSSFAGTKDLPAWGYAVAVAGSIALVLAIANAVIAWERRQP